MRRPGPARRRHRIVLSRREPGRLVEQDPGPAQFLSVHGHRGQDQPAEARAGRPGQTRPLGFGHRGQSSAFRTAEPAGQVVEQGQVPHRLHSGQNGGESARGTGHTGEHGACVVEASFPQTGRTHVCHQQGAQFRMLVQQVIRQLLAEFLGRRGGLLGPRGTSGEPGGERLQQCTAQPGRRQTREFPASDRWFRACRSRFKP